MLMVGGELFRKIDPSCWETRAKKAVMPSSHEAGAKNTEIPIMQFVPDGKVSYWLVFCYCCSYWCSRKSSPRKTP